MLPDAFDLRGAVIHRSPADIADWPITLTIRGVRERAAGGFELLFDREPPERWKWFTGNVESPTDNFQFTVWAFLPIGGTWHGAGIVQMWQGRSMRENALPPMFSVVEGVPGWRNWWGDPRAPWGELSGVGPVPGMPLGLMVSAGDARFRTDVSSVPERSNVVVVMVPATDELVYDVAPGPGPVDPPPGPDTPPDPPPARPPEPPPGDYPGVIAQLTRLEALVTAYDDANARRYAAVVRLLGALGTNELVGDTKLPMFGTVNVVLRPRPGPS